MSPTTIKKDTTQQGAPTPCRPHPSELVSREGQCLGSRRGHTALAQLGMEAPGWSLPPAPALQQPCPDSPASSTLPTLATELQAGPS